MIGIIVVSIIFKFGNFMDSKVTLEPFLNKLKADVFASTVEKTITECFSSPPPHSLEPKKVWKQKIRSELMDLYSGQAAIDKITAGFDAIASDLHRHLSSKEFEKISKEWEEGVKKWISLAKEKPTAPSECLQEMMGISEETLTQFYQAAQRYFRHKDFQKASDALYVIVGLDPRRYNVWLALGLSEAHNHRFEQALISFSMASIADSESPYPYIYSAEVCIKENRMDEAKIYCDLAKEAVENGKLEDKQLLNVIQKLKSGKL